MTQFAYHIQNMKNYINKQFGISEMMRDLISLHTYIIVMTLLLSSMESMKAHSNSTPVQTCPSFSIIYSTLLHAV